MKERNVFACYLAIALTAAGCGVFGSPKVNTPCGVCETITIAGEPFDICGKPTEIQRLKALEVQKVAQ